MNESPRWIYCEWQPEAVEFEDGASDVPFTIVLFLPALQVQNERTRENYVIHGYQDGDGKEMNTSEERSRNNIIIQAMKLLVIDSKDNQVSILQI